MTSPEYRQPTHREELERELVHGAATQIAHEPHRAGAIAEAIKSVLDTLHPIAATPASGPANAHASAVLYPAIERAMGELSKLPEGFNMEANRAFNILHDAFWSECPAPASAVPKRRETPAAEPALPIIDPAPMMADGSAADPEKFGVVAIDAIPVVDPGPDSLEREIQAKANNGPRVTPDALKSEIVSEHYFTAGQGWSAANFSDRNPPVPLNLLTFCVLVLRNDFTVIGHSACASPENFNAEIGRRIARENAVEKVWPLLGFRLRDELARPVLTEADAAADLAGTPRPDNPAA